MAPIQWSDGAPIYRQLKDRVIAMMLDGILKPGDALPSVRQVAAEYQLNPITVSRAYQELADEALVEKRRGLGMYVPAGAPSNLLASEREHFRSTAWPAGRWPMWCATCSTCPRPSDPSRRQPGQALSATSSA